MHLGSATYFFIRTATTMATAAILFLLIAITMVVDSIDDGSGFNASLQQQQMAPNMAAAEEQMAPKNIQKNHDDGGGNSSATLIISSSFNQQRQPSSRWRLHRQRQRRRWRRTKRFPDGSTSIIDSKRYYNTNYEDYHHHYYSHIPNHQEQPDTDQTDRDDDDDHNGYMMNNVWPQTMKNITVTQGRNATFECVFPKLGNFRLAWLHKDRGLVLATHDLVISKSGRISVRSHANTTFYLTIHDVQEKDRGYYMCQVNTEPMRNQIGHLEVNVPPSFVESGTSSDMEVDEYSSVTLQCEANGRPKPTISWRREVPDQSQPIPVGEGNRLDLVNITRHQMGAYLCIASNGIPTTISQRIFVGVSFTPVIRTHSESLSVPISVSVTIECHIESYPRPVVQWNRDDPMNNKRIIIHPDRKYNINLNETNIPFKFISRLKIYNVQKDDFGRYICNAQNKMGSAKTVIRLTERPYKKPPPPTTNNNRKIKNYHPELRTSSARPPSKGRQQDAESSENSNGNHFKGTKSGHESHNYETTQQDMWDFDTNYLNPELSGAGKNNSPDHHCSTSGLAVLFAVLMIRIGNGATLF